MELLSTGNASLPIPSRLATKFISSASDAYRLTFVLPGPVLPRLLDQIGKVRDSPAADLRHLGVLLQVAQSLHRAAALEEVLTAVLHSAIRLTEAERGLLFLMNEKDELRLRLARSREELFLPLDQTDYSQTIVERVVRLRREEVLLEDELTGRTEHEPGVVALPLQKLAMTESDGETIRQIMPQLLGVLYLETRLHPGSVTELDREVLQTLVVEGATVRRERPAASAGN